MKKLALFLVFCFLTVYGYAQDCIQIKKSIYTGCYSTKFRSPLTIIYKIYKPKSLVSREGMSFYKERGVITASDADYKDNVYDKGHMAAAETFSDSEEHMHDTFSYLNCAVQHYKLNRGVWKSLEMHERQWAHTDSLLVTNTVIFNLPLHPMKSGAYIPDYFEKKIVFLSTGIVKTYRFPNVEPKSNDINYYLVK